MKLNANGLSHLGLRVTNLARAKRFYVDTLGCQLVRETDGGMLVNVSGMLVALSETDSYSSSYDRFNPFRVGLDHLALAVEDPSILLHLCWLLGTSVRKESVWLPAFSVREENGLSPSCGF